MSRVDVRERCRDSPERARSLFTVRAAISSARSSERPCSLALCLTCSYWRARLVPFLIPRGGMGTSFGGSTEGIPGRPSENQLALHEVDREAPRHQREDDEEGEAAECCPALEPEDGSSNQLDAVVERVEVRQRLSPLRQAVDGEERAGD